MRRNATVSDATVSDALWDLVFAGLITSDSLGPLRARLTGGKTTHRSRTPAPRARMRGPSGLALLSAGRGRGRPTAMRAGGIRRGVPPSVVGRWSLVPEVETDVTVRTACRRRGAAGPARDRHPRCGGRRGHCRRVRRRVPGAGRAGGDRPDPARVLHRRARGLAVRLRRGGGPGAGLCHPSRCGRCSCPAAWCWPPPTRPTRTARRCRGRARPVARPIRVVTAERAGLAGQVQGPEMPAGAASGVDRHRPARRAGALTVLVDGAAVLYAERGGRSLLSFTSDTGLLTAAAEALAERVRSGRIGSHDRSPSWTAPRR